MKEKKKLEYLIKPQWLAPIKCHIPKPENAVPDKGGTRTPALVAGIFCDSRCANPYTTHPTANSMHNVCLIYDNVQVLKYTAGHINYGGRVTDDWDRRCLMNILSDYYKQEVIDEEYSYSESKIYHQIPPSTDHGVSLSFGACCSLSEKK